jgi:mono/diheme cytochrome c family protein
MRTVPVLLGLAGVAAALVARVPATAAIAQPDGATIYKRCAACHLVTGAGVPGAFPPLAANVKALSQTPAGRSYMSLAVIKGLSGPLIVDAKTYRGIMPAQAGLDDAAIAAVLNHVVTSIAKGSGKSFTAAEVAAARKAGTSLTSANIVASRPGVRRK